MDRSGYCKLWRSLFVAIIVCVTQVGSVDRVIDMTPMTIKVVTGTTALLPCSVDPRYTEKHADQYKVMWVNPQDTAISIQDRRVINDQRISVERTFLKDWNLHIRNVSMTDAGVYKCQINTKPVGTKKITLIVQDPPRIIDHSVPLVIQKPEGGKVELFCNATGFPLPNITWYRLHRNTHGNREKVGNVGDSLIIRNISRMCGDFYECMANNGVEPAMSQTFEVTVLYPPEVTLHNSRLGQKAGLDTVLECDVSASPLAYVVWKHRNRTLVNSINHELTLYNSEEDNPVVLSLRILKISAKDYGIYECEAKNKLGTTVKSMELYEIRPKTSTTTTTTTTERYKWRPENKNKDVSVYGGVNGGGGSQGLIWDRQKDNQKSSYSSRDDALRSKNGGGRKDNSRTYQEGPSKDRSHRPLDGGNAAASPTSEKYHRLTGLTLFIYVLLTNLVR